MKKTCGLIALVVLLNSCAQIMVVNTKPPQKTPPGQMKKVTGSQSAKPYAPGQQKKQNGQQKKQNRSY